MKRMLAIAMLVGGCGKPRTEVVIVVDALGLTAPRDFDALHLTVTDPVLSGAAGTLFDQASPLCPPDQSVGGCKSFPVTLTLVPGSDRPKDPVRVQVDALLGAQKIISDAATFTFNEGESARLDFLLYPTCVNVDCAASDRACGPDGSCVALTPMPFGGEPNVDGSGGAGDGGADDLATPPDLLPGPDLLPPPDLSPPMRGCGSLKLDGSNLGVLSAPTLSAYNPQGSFTVEAWVYPTAYPTSGTATLVAHANVAAPSWILYLDTAGRVHFSITADGVTFYEGTTGGQQLSPLLNRWSHVVGIFNQATHHVTAVVDGAHNGYDNPGNAPINLVHTTNAPLTIGNTDPATANPTPFTGQIDEVRISSGLRYGNTYTTDFIPTGRFTADASTIALYHLDDQGSTATDSSSNANAATLQGAATTFVDGCAPYRCGYLSLTGGTFTTPMSNTLNMQGSFTVEAWFAPSVQPNSELVDYSGSGTGLQSYGLSSGQKPNFNVSCDGSSWSYVTDGETTFAVPNIWHHVAGVWDSTSHVMTLYVDGKLAGTSSPLGCAVPYGLLNKALTIGIPGAQQYTGLVDDFRLSTGKRYTTDFVPAPSHTADASTVALYHFDEGSGKSAADQSSNHLDGTLNGVGANFDPSCR